MSRQDPTDIPVLYSAPNTYRKISHYCPQCKVLTERCGRQERDLDKLRGECEDFGAALLRLSDEHRACPPKNLVAMLESLKAEKQYCREQIRNRDRYIMMTEKELHRTYEKLKLTEQKLESVIDSHRGLQKEVARLEKENKWLEQCTKKVFETHSRIADVPVLVKGRGLPSPGEYLSPKESSRSPSHTRGGGSEAGSTLPPRLKRNEAGTTTTASDVYASSGSRYVARALRQGRSGAVGEDRTEAKRDPSQLPAGRRCYDGPPLTGYGATRTMTGGGPTAPDSARLPHSSELGQGRPARGFGSDLARRAVNRQVTRHSTPATGMKPLLHELNTNSHTSLKNGRLASAEPGQVDNLRSRIQPPHLQHDAQPPTTGASEKLVTQSAHKSMARNRPPPHPTSCVALTTTQVPSNCPPLTKTAVLPTPADVHDPLPGKSWLV